MSQLVELEITPRWKLRAISNGAQTRDYFVDAGNAANQLWAALSSNPDVVDIQCEPYLHSTIRELPTTWDDATMITDARDANLQCWQTELVAAT